jgi:hypothetical protein
MDMWKGPEQARRAATSWGLSRELPLLCFSVLGLGAPAQRNPPPRAQDLPPHSAEELGVLWIFKCELGSRPGGAQGLVGLLLPGRDGPGLGLASTGEGCSQ